MQIAGYAGVIRTLLPAVVEVMAQPQRDGASTSIITTSTTRKSFSACGYRRWLGSVQNSDPRMAGPGPASPAAGC
jgi:hypothetical protein